MFDLQTQRKENQHKIDRLQDYERQIEQHVKVQKLWYVNLFLFVVQLGSRQLRDEDFAKFNNRENDIKLMQSQHKQMEMRLESMEKTQEGLEETTRYGSAKRSLCSEKLNDS